MQCLAVNAKEKTGLTSGDAGASGSSGNAYSGALHRLNAHRKLAEVNVAGLLRRIRSVAAEVVAVRVWRCAGLAVSGRAEFRFRCWAGCRRSLVANPRADPPPNPEPTPPLLSRLRLGLMRRGPREPGRPRVPVVCRSRVDRQNRVDH